MGTAILRSKDSVGDGFVCNLNPRIRNGRKRSPWDGNRRLAPGKGGLVMGEVKILKRGEVLLGWKSDLCSTDRLGPDPQVLQKQIKVPDLYAAPTSLVPSPTPREIPDPDLYAGPTSLVPSPTPKELPDLYAGPTSLVPSPTPREIPDPHLYAGPTSLVPSPTPKELPFPAALVQGRKLVNIN